MISLAPPKPMAWLAGYAFEASVPRASGDPLRIEATLSPEGRLLDFGVTGSAVSEDLGLSLVDFFCAEMAAQGVDGPRVVDLIAALPEDSPAALALAEIWEQHPEAQPEPRIVSAASAAPEAAAPEGGVLVGIYDMSGVSAPRVRPQAPWGD